MIIMIILIILVLLFIISTSIGVLKSKNSTWHAEWDSHVLINGAIAIIVGFIALVLGMICIISNSSFQNQKVRISYEQRVEELQHSRVLIENIQDDYARSVATTQYNTSVREFKEELLVAQTYAKNPWTSWFNCQEYLKLDATVVSYVEVI